MKRVMHYMMLFALLTALPQAAFAQAIVSFEDGSEFAIFYGGSTGDVVGFRFEVNTPVQVTSLGVWDGDTQAQAGLTNDHMVGIWDGSNLIASTTVTPAGALVGDFRYAGISPVTLTPGNTYTAGAMYTADDDDGYISSAGSLTAAPEIVFLNAVFPLEGSLGFAYPSEDSPGNNGRFGPNLIFSPAEEVAVPVMGLPGQALMVLLMLALGGLTLRRFTT